MSINQAVILAAGQSSRFWPLNSRHKSLIKIMGKPLIWYTIDGLKKSGIKEVIIVQGPKKEVEEELKKYNLGVNIEYIIQPEPKGTGNAIFQAKDFIKGDFIVLGPHKVNIADYFLILIKKFNGKNIVLTGDKTNTPWDHGIVRFDGQKIIEIVENPAMGQEPSNINAAEAYVLPKDFFVYYEKIGEKEDNLIGTINLIIKERGAEIVLMQEENIALKYPWRLFDASKYLFGKIKKNISGKVEKGANILGEVFVGEGSLIRSGAYIQGPVYIGKNCQIGPNCFIRPYSNIGDNCHIGNGVEIKNSIIGDNSNAPHLNYVGDSIIGENCNLGAGTITANLRFDKKTVKTVVKGEKTDTARVKFGCVMGDNIQTGINCSIMPGILIGKNCAIWPHSSVFENLEDNTNFRTELKGIKTALDGK